MFEKINSHALRVRLLNGDTVVFAIPELKQFLRSQNTLILMAFVPILISLANPRLFPSIPGISTRLFFWSICVAFYALLLPYWLYGVHSLWKRFFTFPLPHPVSSVPFSFLLTIVAVSIPTAPFDLVTPRASAPDILGYLKNSGIVLMIEHIAIVFLMPLHKANLKKKTKTATPEPTNESELKDKFIKLGSHSIPVEAISHVQSQKHHLIVSTGDQERILRSSMSHFLKQVSEGDGIHSHRSYWVSAGDALELAGNTIRTKSGKDIPVSRARRQSVRDWFQKQGKPF